MIKVAPVVVACERLGLSVTLLMTGQHQETMQDLIDEFSIRSPQVSAMPASERSTVRSLLYWLPVAYRGVVKQLKLLAKPGVPLDVLVHGDTLSTLVGAVAGRRCGARIVHLESGLSSGRIFDPFPEELCRRLVFRMTDVAMCPNAQAADYMRLHHDALVIDTKGNTIIDAVILAGAVSVGRETNHPYLVVSLHRFQNIYVAQRLSDLVALVERLAESYPIHFVLHPATRRRLEAGGFMARLSNMPNLNLIPRMGYRDFLRLAAGAACVLTDGGSNQEELAALGVPTLVMRERTERPDGLGANAIMEAGIAEGVVQFIHEGRFVQLRHSIMDIHRDGPSHRIAEFLADEGSQYLQANS
ncbi:UDP-N-acetylglucosamine 2-epimerase [Dyella sp. OK004]|uniref:UDP-N-acetylglucosamine 2-epimerase n=1 Tax=Dyella sp. OK004 TaxID=1855292 RepID=UPI0015A7053F|nr:UDP-N-acetylglucosamine 2-epimerase [Dyella sp. OK004]